MTTAISRIRESEFKFFHITPKDIQAMLNDIKERSSQLTHGPSDATIFVHLSDGTRRVLNHSSELADLPNEHDAWVNKIDLLATILEENDVKKYDEHKSQFARNNGSDITYLLLLSAQYIHLELQRSQGYSGWNCKYEMSIKGPRTWAGDARSSIAKMLTKCSISRWIHLAANGNIQFLAGSLATTLSVVSFLAFVTQQSAQYPVAELRQMYEGGKFKDTIDFLIFLREHPAPSGASSSVSDMFFYITLAFYLLFAVAYFARKISLPLLKEPFLWVAIGNSYSQRLINIKTSLKYAVSTVLVSGIIIPLLLTYLTSE